MFAFLWMDVAAAAAQDASPPALPGIEVIEAAPHDPALDTLTSEHLRSPSGGDLAELLRAINGVASGRMGGHGLEPVIRGQSQGQLNIRFDGMELHGACPNRMDPPTAFAQPAGIDRVTIEKGVQTLQHGPGGSGGTVLIERRLPWARDGVEGRASASLGDNGGHGLAAADLGAAGDVLAWRVLVAAEDHGNYEDGDGDEVRSAFDRRSANLMLGARPGDRHDLELGIDHSETRDAYYAGAGMDAPEERLTAARLRHRMTFASFDLTSTFWRAQVDHVMDNFSLRPLAAGAMAMRVPSQALTRGATIQASFASLPEWQIDAGFQFARVTRDATRYAGPTPGQIGMVNALLWPDVTLDRSGIFVEGRREFDRDDLLTLGLRWDRFEADAAWAQQRVSAMVAAPAQFYAMYYDDAPVASSDSGLGALLRYQRGVGDRGTAFVGASRSLRPADSTERYIAAMAPMPSGRWIGNPTLRTEAHHQFDAGYAWRGERREASLTVFVDDVRDYILRDRARRQDGIRLADGATVYRNVDARLTGVELAYAQPLGEHARIDAQLGYVRGENRSDGRVLAQMPPLDGRIALARASRLGEWSMVFRGGARQHRADTSVATGSGLDARATPGYGVLDLGWRKQFGSHLLQVRLDNLFDRTYAEHLNRANLDPFNPTPIQVNEPGRTLRLAWETAF
jgi:iron complex outermembrane receptor protein